MKFIFLLLAFGVSAFAQTADVVPFTKSQYFDANGNLCAGCLMWTYQAGTATLQTTYTASGGSVANTNPVVLDGVGRADIFLGPYSYKLVLESAPLAGQTHGSVIWTEDNIKPLGLIAYVASGGTTNACAALYNPTIAGVTNINLCTFIGDHLDVRSFGAVGFTGNCHTLTVDDQPMIQAALNYAAANGPLKVYLPAGYCWPIASHVWVPQNVDFGGGGRTLNYEQSSTGSLLIANQSYPINATFPYTQMVWVSGDNYTNGTVTAINVTFGTRVHDMEINCNDTPGCGNIYAIGRQEKSHLYSLLLTGSTTPTNGANAGFAYSWYEQGVDCNGSTPNAKGCLIPMAGVGSINPGSGQQGPDWDIEIFPSFNTEPAMNYWIPWALMGAANYYGFKDSTINGYYGSNTPYASYFWGSNSVMGPYHTEGISSGGIYIGPTPYFQTGTCTGADHTVFDGIDTTAVISSCAAQQQLTFRGQGSGGNTSGASPYTIINAKNSTNISDDNYCFDISIVNGSIVQGPCGTRAGVASVGNIMANDPGMLVQNGYAGIHEYVGTPNSGLDLGIANQNTNNTTRGYACGNLYLSTTDWTTWYLGGDGGSDYSCVGFANGGNFEVSTNLTAPSSFLNSVWNTNVAMTVSGLGHTLIGPGWINGTSNLTQGEQSAALQVHGGISGDVQMGSSSSSTCPTSTSAGSTCAFSVVWAYPYTSTTYPAVCSLMDATGAPSVKGVARTTTGVTVTIQNGQGSQAVASGGSGVSCWATPTAVP